MRFRQPRRGNDEIRVLDERYEIRRLGDELDAQSERRVDDIRVRPVIGRHDRVPPPNERGRNGLIRNTKADDKRRNRRGEKPVERRWFAHQAVIPNPMASA